MELKHFFIPHPDTHERAYLISKPAIFIYILFFISLQIFFSVLKSSHPGVLGIAANINQQNLITLVNQERAKNGLGDLKENQELDAAAAAKAQNMFAENYWAHFSPSGKSPWDFIKSSGYSYSYAGENLARNFQTSDEVVVAWMNSPSHRENLLNSHYQDMGIAVVNGVLEGEQTTLVVQEFGAPVSAIAAAPTAAPSALPQVASAITAPAAVPNISTAVSLGAKPLLDPFATTKNISIIFILGLMGLIALDFVIIKRRQVYRIASHHLSELIVLAILVTVMFKLGPGLIQ